MMIEDRNRIRRDAGLPLLSVEAEVQRQNTVREQTQFNLQFEQQRSALCHQWTNNGDGWMTNMGQWSRARRLVRDEMYENREK